jgi:hypothetical protein
LAAITRVNVTRRSLFCCKFLENPSRSRTLTLRLLFLARDSRPSSNKLYRPCPQWRPRRRGPTSQPRSLQIWATPSLLAPWQVVVPVPYCHQSSAKLVECSDLHTIAFRRQSRTELMEDISCPPPSAASPRKYSVPCTKLISYKLAEHFS